MTAPTSLDARHRRWPVALALVVALFVATVVGVTTASADGSLGPHEAHYEVTTDDTVTIDLGPLGTLQIDSPLPFGLGVRVRVEEIPEELVEVSPGTTLQSLSGDLQGYIQLFSAPRATIEQAERALVVDAIRRSLLTFVLILVGWLALHLVLGPARRAEIGGRLEPHARQIAVGIVLVVVGAGVLTASTPGGASSAEGQPASSVFDGTPLAGARVTGRLGGVIDTYGAQVVEAYQRNQKFYARANRNLERAWDARAATLTAEAGPTASPTGPALGGPATLEPPPTAIPTPPATAAPGSTSTTPATPTSSTTPTTPPDELVTVLLMSDLHCNVGMAPLVHTLALRSGADLVLDGGDTTMDGTSVEKYCVTTFADAIPKGVPLVTSPGNHDSRGTSAEYAKAGATVLAGKPVTVDGIRILGDHDPNETRIGEGTSQVGRETAAAEGARLADVACDDDHGVDLLLIHTPWVGDPVLASGCVPSQISGHLHKHYGPLLAGQGVRYVNASTAGAVLGKPTIGPLNGTSEMTVLRWDPATRRFVDYQLVEVHPDTTATVSERLPWPAATPTAQFPPDVPTSAGD